MDIPGELLGENRPRYIGGEMYMDGLQKVMLFYRFYTKVTVALQ